MKQWGGGGKKIKSGVSVCVCVSRRDISEGDRY